ncbi:pilus assembly protein TadB [Cupriavidus sp. HPC(L)]|uniref:type II secretion system F family protein n=1 Tax=Cupriavidus sp. HPC(L) TaxID=1217418 RepID=UPI00029101D6|nr:type II secretion system F family protein [Cupriavidus sp. HPC(L)]ESH89090.1 pilus assembly protein TadB [Cupriavidus sp. HPC(L)]
MNLGPFAQWGQLGHYALYAFGVLLFIAVVLAIEAVYLWWNSHHGASARRIDARIRALSAGGQIGREQMSILKERMLAGSPRMQRLLMRVPRVAALDRWLQQSGSTWSVGQLLGFSAASLLIAFAVLSLLPLPFWLAAGGALLAAALPCLRTLAQRQRRLKRMEAQLPDAIDMISRLLRAGHSFAGALGTVGQEMKAPLGPEFRLAFEEINYGVSLDDALTSLAMRVPVGDLRYFVIAVLIQRESGGNLAEVLDTISRLVRERLKLFDKIRVLSAEGRLSAWILGLLPFGTAGLISVLNPGFLDVLWQDPAGIRMAGTALIMMALGVLWMRKIIRIRV